MHYVYLQTKIKQEMSETIQNLYSFSQPAFIKHLLDESMFSKFPGQIEKQVTVYDFKETVIHGSIKNTDV